MKAIAVSILSVFLATAASASDAPAIAVIPLPQKISMQEGSFQLTGETRVLVDSSSLETGEMLAKPLRLSTGYPLKISKKSGAGAAVPGGILLTTKNADTNLGAEGYELSVGSNSVVIRAPTQAGLFYGAESLLQSLPPEIFSTNPVSNVAWSVPCMQIEDWPRFKWRGLMFDVSRHFFTKTEVETVLDAMAMHKMNVLHWHLTDDHGWRIEIKKYPKLTQIGAWRANNGFGFDPKTTTAYGPDGRYGGFYTQNDIREVVKYAAARHIMVVPEIEMPGHATAALAAYPEYSCTGGPFEPSTNAGIFAGIYDPAKEETFKFLDGVLAEVIPLFPAPYVHIGGDEVPKETWKKAADCQALMKREGMTNEEELQKWFTRRVEKIVNAHGRSIIGWSEIMQGGLAPSSAVMDWIGGAKAAAAAGHDVVMTPTAFCYLDFYQSSNHATEPRAATWPKFPLTLSKMYSFEPMPTNVPPELQSHILGAQANLWTEQMPNLKQAEYMLFPRTCALAEVTWSAPEARNWNDFMRRLTVDVQRLNELNIYYRHASIESPASNSTK